MNPLWRIPRQTTQCLRSFATTSQRAQGAHTSFLNSLDPLQQVDEAPPTPKPRASSLGTLLGKTMRTTRPDRSTSIFSSPTTAVGSDSHTKAMKELQNTGGQRAILQQMPRRWREGDVYAPHDLTIGEAKKWKKIVMRPEKDVFDMLGKNPLAFYKNLPLLHQFTTETGRIKAGKVTGLRLRNQRRIAKAVRRAIGIGLMPSVYAHPELQAEKLRIADYRQERDPSPGFD